MPTMLASAVVMTGGASWSRSRQHQSLISPAVLMKMNHVPHAAADTACVAMQAVSPAGPRLTDGGHENCPRLRRPCLAVRRWDCCRDHLGEGVGAEQESHAGKPSSRIVPTSTIAP
jgi:hypothetical protein